MIATQYVIWILFGVCSWIFNQQHKMKESPPYWRHEQKQKTEIKTRLKTLKLKI